MHPRHRPAVNPLQHNHATVARMTLSFVVPAYNEEHYLPDCLRSILRETAGRPDVEIIVVDNASTDQTAAVARSFPGVRVVAEPRKGLPHARQAGFLASRGTLVANVDADARLPAGWLAQVLAGFSADPGLVALSGPLVYYDLSPRERLLVRVFYATAWLTYVANRYVLRVGSMVQGGNFVLRRTALEQIGGFNLDLTFYGEDTDLARRLPRCGRVRFTFALPMFSSARRLKKEGILTMAWRYSANYLWTLFLHRPYTPTHLDIREG